MGPTIRVDRENWINSTTTINVDKVKTVRLLQAMSKIKYFDEIINDLQRRVRNKGNQFNPIPMYWPGEQWINNEPKSEWQTELIPIVTCDLTPKSVIPAMGNKIEPKHVAAIVIPNFDYAITTRGQKARAGSILKDDIQSAIGAITATPNTAEAIEDLTEPESFDIIMTKVIQTDKQPHFGVKQLEFTSSYLLVTDEVDRTLEQLREINMLDSETVKSNILIKSEEAMVLHLMAKAMNLLNKEFNETRNVVPRKQEEEMYEALSNIL